MNRCGLEVPGMPRLITVLFRRVILMGRRFPEMFFVFVLGGEDPIDYVQRESLRSDRELHPHASHASRGTRRTWPCSPLALRAAGCRGGIGI